MNLRKLSGQLCGVLRDTPLGWGFLAGAGYFYYAQFIATIGWNAIELIIAQQVIDHGVYATSVDYPSALPWRPVLPTLVVAAFRLTTSDPLRIYQLVCGVSLASFVASMFLCARLLWGRVAAHVSAFLTIVCPAVTITLIDHAHSYSHMVGLLFLGPALYLGLRLLRAAESGSSAPALRYALSGLAWGLACLCRRELVLFFGLGVVALGWLHLQRCPGRWRRLLMQVGVFALIWIPFNQFVNRVAARDGSLTHKSIYGMYASQGWVDAPPDVGADIERDGYIYAVKLYGDPLSNDESMLRAIVRHPRPFVRRLSLNAANFYRTLTNVRQFGTGLAWAALIGAIVALVGVKGPKNRWSVGFLAGTFGATHFVLIFHVDPRYLTIAAPALILFAASLPTLLLSLTREWRTPIRVALTSGVIALAVWIAGQHVLLMGRHGERPDRAIAAMQSLAQVFHEEVPQPVLRKNREPHIAFRFPDPSLLHWEDMFLLGYFTRTAWFMHAPEAPFPRGRMYGFRECEDDYLFAPSAPTAAPVPPNARELFTSENPVLGRYTLWQLGP